MFVSGQKTDFNISGISRRMRLDLALDSFAILARGTHEFVVQLEAEPEAGRGSEVTTETQIVFRRAATAGFFHIGEVRRGNSGHAGDTLGLLNAATDN